MMIEPAQNKTRSWLKLIAVIIALAGVGFALFLKSKMPPQHLQKETAPKSRVN